MAIGMRAYARRRWLPKIHLVKTGRA